jgi:hypothetical protein
MEGQAGLGVKLLTWFQILQGTAATVDQAAEKMSRRQGGKEAGADLEACV